MKLTKNEKKVLKILLENAKITDSLIAEKLKISSQAVGKIRKKLENSVIDSYTINLNYSKLGIKAFAISLSKLTYEGLDFGELEIEKKLLSISNVIQVCRLPNSYATHVILYGFEDLSTLDEFFHSKKNNQELFKYLENKDLFTFSHNSLIKNDPSQLFKIAIDASSSPKFMTIPELEKFKQRLEK
jgi:DNA-binding Lrp family transcriptional regulator